MRWDRYCHQIGILGSEAIPMIHSDLEKTVENYSRRFLFASLAMCWFGDRLPCDSDTMLDLHVHRMVGGLSTPLERKSSWETQELSIFGNVFFTTLKLSKSFRLGMVFGIGFTTLVELIVKVVLETFEILAGTLLLCPGSKQKNFKWSPPW